MLQRVIGAAMLRAETYEEIEADGSATLQAMLVVVMVAVATGIGNLVTGGATGFLVGILVGLVGWAFWAWTTFLIGTTILRAAATQANWGQLARTLGYAQVPGVFKVFGLVPGVGPVVFILASVWQLAAMVVAIRQALDYPSTWRAIGVALLGFIAYAVLLALVFFIVRGPSPAPVGGSPGV